MALVHPHPRDIRIGHIAALSAQVGADFRVQGKPAGANETVLEGDYSLVRLRPGLVVHASDATDLCDITTSVVQPSGLSIHLFLEGMADASIGGQPLGLGRRPGEPVKAVITARARPDIFERRAHKGSHMRKVNINISSDWLEECAFQSGEDYRVVRRFAREHLAQFSWIASPHTLALAEQILHPPQHSALMQKLYLESRALDLVFDAFAALTSHAPEEAPTQLKPHDRRRLLQIEEYLEHHGHEAPSLDQIASCGGVSTSTLRRLFKAAYGTSVMEHLRRKGLEKARMALERQGVSVAEAAYLAGYSNAANFATAFKRAFGLTPTEARRTQTPVSKQ